MNFVPRFPWSATGAALVTSLLLSACGGSQEPAAVSSTLADGGNLTSALPADSDGGLSLTLETSQASSALVPPTGGSLTAEGADGTLYTLEIPGGALLVET